MASLYETWSRRSPQDIENRENRLESSGNWYLLSTWAVLLELLYYSSRRYQSQHRIGILDLILRFSATCIGMTLAFLCLCLTRSFHGWHEVDLLREPRRRTLHMVGGVEVEVEQRMIFRAASVDIHVAGAALCADLAVRWHIPCGTRNVVPSGRIAGGDSLDCGGHGEGGNRDGQHRDEMNQLHDWIGRSFVFGYFCGG